MPGKCRTALTVLTCLLLLTGLVSAQELQLDVKEHELENGMRVLVVERHDTPRIACRMAFAVGAVNEQEGRSGIAHLLEHMMFKGTRTLGTRDVDREQSLMAQIDAQMARIDALRGNDDDASRQRTAALMAGYHELLARQRDLMVSNEVHRVYQTAGATGLNAFTSYDRTVYTVEVPSNKLELFMWVDSDRMANPVFREFYSERDVVLDEWRRRMESNPYGPFYERLNAVFYTSHPYRRPILGWLWDVERLSRADAAGFFATHYIPANATLVLVGDVVAEEAFAMAKRYFGRIPAKPGTAPRITREPEQGGERRLTVRAQARQQVDIQYHTPHFTHPDSPALEVAAGVLNGRSGRLYKDLVLDKDIALSAGAWASAQRYTGEFGFSGQVKEGHTHQEVEAALLAQAALLVTKPPTEHEMGRIRNAIEAEFVNGLRTNGGIAGQLAHYATLGDWHLLLSRIDSLKAVTPDDVARVAERYLTESNRTVGWLLQETPTPTTDPAAGGDAQ